MHTDNQSQIWSKTKADDREKGNAPQNLMDTQVFDLKSQLMDASDSQAVLNRQK